MNYVDILPNGVDIIAICVEKLPVHEEKAIFHVDIHFKNPLNLIFPTV